MNRHLSRYPSKLIEACEFGYTDDVENLLLDGIDPDIQKWGKTALISASENDQKNCIGLLFEYGADFNLQNYGGWTALMLAVYNFHEKSAQLLLENYANPDLQNLEGMTALMYACENDDGDCAEILLEYGADPDVQDIEGRKAIDHAHSDKIKDIILNGVFFGPKSAK